METIKSNELRIGNILNYDTKEVEGVVPTIIDCETPEAFNEFHSHIPLSEEWLLKFGFKLSDDEIGYREWTHDGDDILVIRNDGGFDDYKNQSFYFEYDLFKSVVIQYVHQLQSLFFALTGEELTIKE